MSLTFPIPGTVGQSVTLDGQTWVWDGKAWRFDDISGELRAALTAAPRAKLEYDLLSGAGSLVLTTPDSNGASYILSTTPPFEGIDVLFDGVRQREGGTYTVNTSTNTITFTPALSGDTAVDVDIFYSPDGLAPGAVLVHQILEFDTAWSVGGTPSGEVDGVNVEFDLYFDNGGSNDPIPSSREEEFSIYFDGVRQRPGVDYTITGAKITMATPPRADGSFWGIWHQPA